MILQHFPKISLTEYSHFRPSTAKSETTNVPSKTAGYSCALHIALVSFAVIHSSNIIYAKYALKF